MSAAAPGVYATPRLTANVGADGVVIQEIPPAELFPPEFHPFQVNNDEAMQNLIESIKQYGDLTEM